MKQFLKNTLKGDDSIGFESPKGLESTMKYPAIVEEIHNKFNNEAQELAKQAQQIINNRAGLTDMVENKGSLAASLGFSRIKEVEEYNEKKEILQKNEKVLEAVIESIEYLPSNKWIPEDSVQRICKYYGLVLGKASMYKGFLPIKNLKEIEEFKDKHEGKFIKYFCTSIYSMIRDTPIPEEISKEEYLKYSKDNRSFYMYSKEFVFNICAPLKDMDIPKGYSLKDHKIERDVPDPIVLVEKSFKGIKGYYIVTAWGDEASDEEVEGYNNG